MVNKSKLARWTMGCALIAAGLSTTSFARPAYETETDYFSDAAHTTLVGNYTLFCSGASVGEGVRTQYSRVVYSVHC